MITPALVQADVVDIRHPASALPPDLVLDANVLYWLFYSNFASLTYAGGRLPLRYQLEEYKKYWQRANNAGTGFFAVPATLGEFAKTAEHAELETIWLTDFPMPQPDPAHPVTAFDPRVCKFARYHYSGHLGMVRRAVDAMIHSLRKFVGLLPQFPTPDDSYTHSVGEWLPSCADFPDAHLIAAAKQQARAYILSDDMDFATFPGITLYTANQRTITAAHSAGKLR